MTCRGTKARPERRDVSGKAIVVSGATSRGSGLEPRQRVWLDAYIYARDVISRCGKPEVNSVRPFTKNFVTLPTVGPAGETGGSDPPPRVGAPC
jgi:hypothetical protein